MIELRKLTEAMKDRWGSSVATEMEQNQFMRKVKLEIDPWPREFFWNWFKVAENAQSEDNKILFATKIGLNLKNIANYKTRRRTIICACSILAVKYKPKIFICIHNFNNKTKHRQDAPKKPA